MMGSDDGPGISFHDFKGVCTFSVTFTEELFTTAVLKTDIKQHMMFTVVRIENYLVKK